MQNNRALLAQFVWLVGNGGLLEKNNISLLVLEADAEVM